MPWLKIDDGMWSNPKWLTVSPAAKALWTWAASYSSDKLTDGIMRPVDWQALAVFVGVTDWQSLVAELEAHRFLDPGPGGALVIHDYLKYNPCKADVLAEREAARKRMCALRSGEHRQNTIDPVPTRPVPVPHVDDDVVARAGESEPDDDDLPATMPIADQRKVLALDDVGVGRGLALELASKCTLPRIQQVIAHARASPGLQNPTGWIISMLRSGQAIPKPPLPGGKNVATTGDRRGFGSRGAPRKSWDEIDREIHGARASPVLAV
jgi:hypothetical protein